MLRNLAADLSRRLRGTSETTVRALEQELELACTRVAMGRFITYVFGLMVGYAFVLRLAADLTRSAAHAAFVSIPLILCFTAVLYAMARHTGEPPASYGLTLRGWRPALADALRFTLPVLALMTLVKWLLVRTVPGLANQPTFYWGGAFDPATPPEAARLAAIMGIAYAVVVPFQEFAARGALQGPLERFLTGPRSTLIAILVANGLFIASHLHLSAAFAMASVLPGLLWGWLYARNRTLVGPVASHILVGWYALYALGLQRLLTH
jgi:membrane protease YdiL (CAAX protease family)